MTLASRLLAALQSTSNRPCLEEPGRVWRYGELLERAAGLATAWDRADPGRAPVALLCDHSFTGYAAMAAALVSGRPYVPLHPGLPAARIPSLVRACGCRLAVADAERAGAVRDLLAAGGATLVSGLDSPSTATLRACADSPAAYVLFTSGSTGEPKGVTVGSAAVDTYCAAARTLFPLHPDDRCTQLFDLSFDLSVHDVVSTFLAGACLVIDRKRQHIDPVGFAADARISAWFSVPSVLAMARAYRRLQPGVLPDLRLALFCGEPLPVPLAQDFLAAAPRAEAFNLYGPTEATIAITAHRLDRSALAGASEPWVPIGHPFPGSECLVVDESGQTVSRGAEGELWLGGPQLAEGYLGAPDLTERQFVSARFAGQASGRWYRSGDRVATSDDEGLLFRGRLDDQVKIGGHRIELGEIENVLRATGLVSEVAAFAMPGPDGGQRLACAVAGPLAPVEQILAAARAQLAAYMVPSRLLVFDALPRSAHGKLDRRALASAASVAPAAAT